MPPASNMLETNPEQYARVERLTTIEERLAKTYSSERYKEFQDAVEEISGRYLSSDQAHEKLRPYLQGEIKDFIDKRGWQNKVFWIPTIIAAVAAIAAVIALFKP